jgi:hypothetical protein
VALNYIVIAQSMEDVRNILNSPSINMSRYLLHSAQTQLLRYISIYAVRGTTSEQLRFLYMNPVAFGVWAAMRKTYRIIGQVDRPPSTATLVLGEPFSE